MKNYWWVILFITALAAETIAVGLQNHPVQLFCKPLLMILLGLYFISGTRELISKLKKWVILALFFSWAGDILLLFQDREKLFFLLGLSAFLVAHLFYIVFFHSIRVKEKIRSNYWLLLIVVIYYAILLSILSPYLADMKLPVRIYGIVISFMFMLAMHMLFIKHKAGGVLMMAGALLFVISDSLLAFNKFYQPFEIAGVLIMVTYGLAQLFIVEGAIRYIRSADSD